MTYSEDQIKNMVRKVLLRTLGPNGIEDNQPVEKGQVPFRLSRQTVTEADVLSVPAGGRLAIPAEAMITPLARDTALDRRVELVREPATAPKEHQITRSQIAHIGNRSTIGCTVLSSSIMG